MPLLGPSIKALLKRGCCCCKKQSYNPEKHLNPPFAIERRYAGIINTCFLVSSYSFSLPVLPFIGSVVLSLQYIVDKLLITYYYKEVVEHNDMMNRTALRIIKYGIIVFYFFGGMAIAANYCQITNKGTGMQLDHVTQCMPCFKVYSDAYIMFGVGIFYLLMIMTVSKFKNSKREEIKFYDELADIE